MASNYSYTVTGDLVQQPPPPNGPATQQKPEAEAIPPVQDDQSERPLDDEDFRNALSGATPAKWDSSLVYEDESTFGHSTDSVFQTDEASPSAE